MGLFDSLFTRKNKPGTPAYRLRMAEELHGQVIRYVTERRNDNDDVVGKSGVLCLHDGVFLVDCEKERVFSCPAAELDASYLMSGDGVILTGPDAEHGGTVRSLTAHFVYYRK